jgi:serine/threonine-protein kinase RsbW
VRSGITIAARVEELKAARAFIEKACAAAGASARDAFDLKLAVDEACTNIIQHGYGGRGDGVIELTCEHDTGALRVTLLDRGRAFSPRDLPETDTTSGWAERPIGGLGWHFIRSSVDAIDYRADPANGNRLTLVKRLAVPQTKEKEIG